MNAKTKKLTIALAVLILLASAYFGAQAWQKKKAAAGQDASSYEEAARLTNFDTADIKKIEIISTGLVLVKNEDAWELATAGKRGVAIEQYAVSGRLWSIANIIAERIVEEEPHDIFQYGFDDSQEGVIITGSNGLEAEVFFGSMTADRNSFYAMLKGDPRVYTVSSYSAQNILFSLDDIRRKELLPDFEPYSLTRLIIEKSGVKIEIEANDDENNLVSAFSLFVMNSPYRLPRGTDTDKFGAFLKNLANIRIEAFIDDEPESLSAYGLDRAGRFYVESPDHKLDLRFGYGNNDGRLYVKFADASGVFIVSGLEELVNTKPFAIVDKFIQIYNITSVKDFTVSGEGKKLYAEIRHTASSAADDEPGFFVNGRKARDDEFRTYYQSVISLMAEAEYPGLQGRTAADSANPDSAITITINFIEPAGAVYSVKFIPYNRDFYSVVQQGISGIDGIEEFLISRSQLRNIFVFADNIVYEG
ncbi:MAG: DUF4340 domain-containing protein [Treponema sp.]|jgi:hypothetical protein|nr:DUF4340 domain-containing protein [Treponema sp.]